MKWTGRLVVCGLLALGGGVLAASAAYVRVKVETANVRGGPSPDAPRLRRAFENDPLRVVARRGPWLRVVDFLGQAGWIHASVTDRSAAVIVTGRSANVRSGPGTSHEVLFTAERGVGFRVLDGRGGWLHVEHADGDRGWVYRPLVWGAVDSPGG